MPTDDPLLGKEAASPLEWLREIERKATPGPWHEEGHAIRGHSVEWDEEVYVVQLYRSMGGDDCEADARLIVVGRNVLAALIGVAEDVECSCAVEKPCRRCILDATIRKEMGRGDAS